MSRRVLIVVWLTGLWILLWRDLSVANLLSGLAIGLATSGRASSHAVRAPTHGVRPVELARFAVFFAWKLLEANIVLAREVLTPTNVIRTGIVAVPMAGHSDFVVTVVANAISLTPGTLTLEVRTVPEPVLYVHVLHLRDVDEARRQATRIAELVSAAFPVADRSSVAGDRT